MGFFARLFAPLAVVLAATGLWLAAEHERDTVFAVGPGEEQPANLSPAAGAALVKAPGEWPARERFARAFDRADPRPRIAVIVTGLGLLREATLRAIDETPPEVTLAFSPYAENAADLIERARERGHEILLAAPMEPSDPKRRDAGPQALAASLSEAAARQRLDWMLDRGHSQVGVIGDLGDRFARDPAAMKPVLDALAARGLVYVANRFEDGDDEAAPAAANGVPAAAVSVWLDRDLSEAAMARALAAAEARARRDGRAVVLAQPYASSLARLGAWLEELEGKGLKPAPITAVAREGS
jgi:polysaccharide deacetylase 2 family uncharacterized protein YibQ